jgi:hypothetical protein
VNGAASHLDLLSMARDVRHAAEDDDTERLHAELARLRSALLNHMHAEGEHVGALPASARRVITDGHRRLLRLLDEVLFGPEDGGEDGCTCLVRAAEIQLSLRRQAQLEATLLRRHRPRGPASIAGTSGGEPT